MRHRKILVVEEDPDRLRRIREILNTQGHQVVTVPDFEMVVERAARELPDLVLMGGGPADPHNHDAARKLHEEPRTSAIPVLTLSSPAELEAKRRPGRRRGTSQAWRRGERERFVGLVEDALRIDGLSGGVFTAGAPAAPVPVDPATDAGVVVVVEEGQKHWKEISSRLGPLGFTVRHAGGEEEALRVLAEGGVDLLLVDGDLGAGEGAALVRRIRADGARRSIPMALLTSGGGVSRKRDGIEAGCDDFLDRPFDAAELAARVRSLIRLGWSRSKRRDRDRLDAVLGEMGEGITFVDENWRVKGMNAAAGHLLDIPRPDGGGLDLLGHIYRSWKVGVERASLADAGWQTIRFELRRDDSEGADHSVLSAFARSFPPEEGEGREIVLVFKDVTGRRDEERLKDEFLSTVSHKLKTPLSVILANVEYLCSGYYGELGEEQVRAIREIGIGGQQLLDLFDKLLAFIAPGSLDGPVPTPRTVSSLLRDYVSQAKKRDEFQPARFTLHVDEQAADAIIDFSSFDVALDSIVENAVKFNDRPDAEVRIEASRGGEGEIVVAVADNGPGIAPEHTEKIFQRFYQVEKFHTGNVAGAGLGLPLARRLIERKGGTVEVDSRVGEGSTFRIILGGEAPHGIDR